MAKKKQPKQTSVDQIEERIPNWPAMKPLPPLSDISLSTLVESQIILIPNFWTKKLCKNYVSFLESLPLTTTPGKPKKGDALRVNDRFQVMDDGFANRLWLETGLEELVCGSKSEEKGEETMSIDERNKLWLVITPNNPRALDLTTQGRRGCGTKSPNSDIQVYQGPVL